MKKLKGKLEKLYNNKIIQEYIDEFETVFGYLGHENRTDETDLVLESLLNNEYAMKIFNEDDIADWICSRPARHFMDMCDNLRYFKNNVIDSILQFKEREERGEMMIKNLNIKI